MSDQSWEALSHSNRNLTVDQGTRWISSCCKPENRQIKLGRLQFSSVQSLSHVWLFVIPWTTGLPVHHQLLEFTQTHVHRVGDAIQPSHPLSSPSPPALNLSQHQGLFKWQLFPGLGGHRDDPKMKYVMWVDQTNVCFQIWGYYF